MLTLPERYKIVQATAGAVTTNGGITCDYVSLKNVKRAYIVAHFDQAVGHATGMDPKRATAVAGTGAAAITKTCRIWANEDCAASDTLVAKTAAITYDLTNDIKTKLVVIEIDPANGDFDESYDVLGFAIDNSGQATNLCSVVYYLETAYGADTPPAAITD